MNEANVRACIKIACDGAGGVRAFAKELGVSPSYVSDVCTGRRAPGPPFLKQTEAGSPVRKGHRRIRLNSVQWTTAGEWFSRRPNTTGLGRASHVRSPV